MRLIDADKLLEKTECLFKDLNSTEDYMDIGYNHGVGDSMAIIKNAPTIEAEPVKHGRWIKHEHGFWTFVNDRGERDGWLPDYECNLCGSRAWRYASNYCPNCGADMRGDTYE